VDKVINRSPTIGSVHMEPKVVAGADGPNLGENIKRAAGGGAQGGGHEEGDQALKYGGEAEE
jgi:hypothetical protein